MPMNKECSLSVVIVDSKSNLIGRMDRFQCSRKDPDGSEVVFRPFVHMKDSVEQLAGRSAYYRGYFTRVYWKLSCPSSVTPEVSRC